MNMFSSSMSCALHLHQIRVLRIHGPWDGKPLTLTLGLSSAPVWDQINISIFVLNECLEITKAQRRLGALHWNSRENMFQLCNITAISNQYFNCCIGSADKIFETDLKRWYHKMLIFLIFHFLKFLPIRHYSSKCKKNHEGSQSCCETIHNNDIGPSQTRVTRGTRANAITNGLQHKCGSWTKTKTKTWSSSNRWSISFSNQHCALG